MDVAPTLRNYLTKKLHKEGVFVLYADNTKTALEFMEKGSIILNIIDYSFSRTALFDFFEQKQRNAVIDAIPSIVLAYEVKKADVSLLVSYHVKKIIAKPIKVDELLTSIGSLLGIPFSFDKTPCILDTRVNDDVIFIEIALGLNRDKLELLQFRILELIESYKIIMPKILIIMTDLDLDYTDVTNLEFLIDNILAVKIIPIENICILTLNKFIYEFFTENPDYNRISVRDSFQQAAIELLPKESSGNNKRQEAVEKEKLILPATISPCSETHTNNATVLFETRFKIDTSKELSIAIIDDDVITQKIMTAIFSEINGTVYSFLNGESFLNCIKENQYDIIFLDMVMAGINGLEVLKKLRAMQIKTPVIILSSTTHQATIVSALANGAKRYLLKPIKREIVLKKTEEVLNAYI